MTSEETRSISLTTCRQQFFGVSDEAYSITICDIQFFSFLKILFVCPGRKHSKNFLKNDRSVNDVYQGYKSFIIVISPLDGKIAFSLVLAAFSCYI